ncbi:hypothetical protein [Clostridium butyricum]|uniref:hypothetical protein n=1 Tax=Clostridium butyricum TaxID=1492 RepID=UPI0009033390|nr:hypothetical protein [Clostridium butyricum]APF21446.1 hypothetical protein NPD4_3524 [Clostridium butyricum]
MENELIIKTYENSEIQFKTINDESYVKIDEVAKFCGWTYTKEDRPGKVFIRWNTVNKFIKELGLSQEVATGEFIPEYIMYPLIGKANNNKATSFMLWVGKVLTEIRKTGEYKTSIKKYEMMIEQNNEQIYRLEMCIGIHDRHTKMYIRYIKNKLGITRINKDYLMIKNNVFRKFGADKWEDLALIKQDEIFSNIDSCIQLIEGYKQLEMNMKGEK